MWYNVGKRIVAVTAVASLLVVVLYGVVNAQRGEDLETVRGTVERLTTAPKGEVDGAKLDDGTVVHWPPHLERRFTAIVAKGDRIEAAGRLETTPRGDKVLEVRKITNLKTDASRTNEDAPVPPDDLRGDANADVEQRLRAVEKKLDRVLEEIKRLRRD
jgi:hypothetical protein